MAMYWLEQCFTEVEQANFRPQVLLWVILLKSQDIWMKIFRWNGCEEKLELADYKQLKNRYFVRTTAEKAAIEQAFGAVEYVQAEGVTGECAFITAEMDGAAYDKAEGQIGAVLQSIRVK